MRLALEPKIHNKKKVPKSLKELCLADTHELTNAVALQPEGYLVG